MLRQALTRVGTALGYVRAVRAAGMRAAARGLVYVEAAVSREAFSAAASAAACPPLVAEAAEVAGKATQCVRRSFEASKDLLNLLAQ
eukprot:5832229-Heterocapsa_arctica.AAC.1